MNTFQVSLDGGDLFKRHSFKQQPDVHLSPRALQRVDETNDHKSPQLPSNHCSAHIFYQFYYTIPDYASNDLHTVYVAI